MKKDGFIYYQAEEDISTGDAVVVNPITGKIRKALINYGIDLSDKPDETSLRLLRYRPCSKYGSSCYVGIKDHNCTECIDTNRRLNIEQIKLTPEQESRYLNLIYRESEKELKEKQE